MAQRRPSGTKLPITELLKTPQEYDYIPTLEEQIGSVMAPWKSRWEHVSRHLPKRDVLLDLIRHSWKPVPPKA